VSSAGILQQPFAQFRKSFPKKVDAATLKKLSIAPSNEGYVIQTLKFLNLIEKDGTQTEKGGNLFTTHDDQQFAAGLEGIMKEAYASLFELRGDEAWTLDKGALIAYFRQSDRTSEVVGGRQANAFTTLAALAGKRQSDPTRKSKGSSGDTPRPRQPRASRDKQARAAEEVAENGGPGEQAPTGSARGYTREKYGLTVRLEINLPANGSPEVYDAIFKSLRTNLLSNDTE
jgi:hypothetical protein